jgi:predicted S18 family serine protease
MVCVGCMVRVKLTTFVPRLFLLCLFLAILVSPAFAILQSGSIKIFAVTEDNKGMAADLIISTIPGTGRVAFITSNSLVGKDTQTTGNIALKISQSLTGVELVDKDVIFDIRANASEVDGPSAGGAMALLAYSMLSEKILNPAVALTGTINSDGSIGMVGGIGAKSLAASKVGIKLFMIPSGEAVTEVEENGSIETVNLLEYGPRKLGMKVVEVSKIEQAIEYAYSNIEEIQVDPNVNIQMFVPKPIEYESILIPMKKISQNYITEAKIVIEDAKKELEESIISDELRADLYQRHSATKRNVEMAQRFLDNNYLYSSANYAFNARVMAGAVYEVAQNPSLLSSESILLDSKISSLRKEISDFKIKMNFVPINDFEWLVGAQQRIAYAEDALNELDSSKNALTDYPSGSEKEKKQLEEAILFNRVYDYVSAQAWVSVANDFFKQAQKGNNKKIPSYTSEFIELINSELIADEKLINDSNVSSATKAESLRRYNSAKISFDNNFLFAVLYDSSFAKAFILSETNRMFLDENKLFELVEKDITLGANSDSVWANLFFDHAKFYFENALFNRKLGRTEEVIQSLKTSYDLIYLGKKLNESKNTVEEYLAFNEFSDYIDTEPVVDIKYTKREDPLQYIIILFLLLVILLITLIMLLGLYSKARQNKFSHEIRKDKLRFVLNNLDRALSRRRISDAEYFFMKKKYEEELNKKPSSLVRRKKLNLNIDDLRAKQRALQRGLFDLKRHYKEGLIIPEDYEHSLKQVHEEILDIKSEIRILQEENREKRKGFSPLSILMRKISRKKEPALKGTEEKVDEEKKVEASERTKRRKVLKRFAYREDKK